MDTDRFKRRVLWVSAGFNAIAALGFAFPDSVGQIAGLPTPVPGLYSALLTVFVVLFGGMYAWLAMQPRIDPPLLVVAVVGKTGVFLVVLVFWLLGDVPARGVPPAVGDLVFAAIFTWWLLGEGAVAPARATAPSR